MTGATLAAIMALALTASAPPPSKAMSAKEQRAHIDILQACTDINDGGCLMAAARLTRHSDAAVGPLSRSIAKMTVHGQLLALSVIDASKTKAATEAMLAMVNNRRLDPRVRALAIDGLNGRPHKKTTRMLLRALKDKDTMVRAAAARVLSNRLYVDEWRRIVTALLKSAKDPEPSVRIEAIFGVGFSDDKRAGKALMAALGDAHTGVRRAAAEGLGRVKYEPALARLVRLLEDRDDLLVQAVGRALTFQTSQNFGVDRARWARYLSGQERRQNAGDSASSD